MQSFTAIFAKVVLIALSLSSALAFTSRHMKTMSRLGSSFYDITEQDSTGKEVSFEKFKGKVFPVNPFHDLFSLRPSQTTTSNLKVVYGVNVASKCGYTATGYALLSRIAALKDKGVEVALFPW